MQALSLRSSRWWQLLMRGLRQQLQDETSETSMLMAATTIVSCYCGFKNRASSPESSAASREVLQRSSRSEENDRWQSLEPSLGSKTHNSVSESKHEEATEERTRRRGNHVNVGSKVHTLKVLGCCLHGRLACLYHCHRLVQHSVALDRNFATGFCCHMHGVSLPPLCCLE
ncbi:hypothetical protein WJX74_003240 [Apatococcus lobatus]|uniref:Uncharacterized protein n=1 Tax=Apatococcus lobatus TaxID=904363 RepID=A0AAW1QD31_9CHLO